VSKAPKPRPRRRERRVLVIDVGGTNVKLFMKGQKESRKVPSGRTLTPSLMVRRVKETIAGWSYDAISIGFPAPVIHGRPLLEPHNLGKGWLRFDFAKAFGRPVQMINDAAMQALGSYRGGRMLFLGLGTGLGSAMVVDGVVEPMELAHLPYKKDGTFEDYLGLRGLERLGKKRWEQHVAQVCRELAQALEPDYIVLGGGNAKKLKAVPRKAILGSNQNAFKGGLRLWRPTRRSRGIRV
jgi:predicted NBD/HSP70 family sugar kinase